MTTIVLWRFAAAFAALAPCAVMAVILSRMGRGALSSRLIGVALAAGAIIAVLPGAAQAYAMVWAARAGLDPLALAAFKAFFAAGLLEEAAKALAIAVIVRGHFARRARSDLLLGAAATALGFAAIENVGYVLLHEDAWGWVAIQRATTAAPIHTLLGLTLGAFFARAERTDGMHWPWIVAGWLFVAALHGLYDFPLMASVRAPLYPVAISTLADSVSLEPWTLLSLTFALAVSAISASAIFGARAVAPELAAPPSSPDIGHSARVGLAPITDAGLPAVLALAAASCLALSADAYAHGAILWAPIQLVASAVILATLAVFAWPAGQRAQHIRLPHGAALVVTLALCAAVALVPDAWRYARSAIFTHSGVHNLSLSRVREAQENFSVALSEQPDDLRALVGRSSSSVVLQQYDLGLADLDHAISVAPNNAALYAARGDIRNTMHQHDRAFEDFNHALSLAPDNPLLMVARGHAHLAMDRHDAAFADAANAIAKNFRLPAAHVLRASVLHERNDEAGVLAALRMALAFDPKNSGAAFFRGRIQFKRRDYAAAAADFEIAIAQGRREFIALWLFLTRLRMGQNGARELAEWSRVLPKAAWPYPLVEFLLERRDVPSLLAEVKGVDRRCEANFYLGAWMVTQGDKQQARRYLQGAADICPQGFVEKRATTAEVDALALPPPQPARRDPDLAHKPTSDETAKAAPAPSAQVGDLLAKARRHLYADEFEPARAAIDQARQLAPDSVAPDVAWADYLTYARLDAAAAIDVLDRAIARDSGNAETAFTRGRLNYRLRRLRLAVVDLDFAATRGQYAVAPLWLFAARAKLGEDGKAELASARDKLPAGWPRPLYELFLGNISEDDALAQAGDAEQACQAHFYTGVLLSRESPYLRAIEKMSQALKTCRRGSFEGEVAKTEMLTLSDRPVSQAQQAIPPWVRSP